MVEIAKQKRNNVKTIIFKNYFSYRSCSGVTCNTHVIGHIGVDTKQKLMVTKGLCSM